MQSTNSMQNMNNGHEAYKRFLHDAIGPLPIENPLGDLSHPVHSLFRQDNYCVDDGESTSDISDSAYAAMLPALCLATCLIGERRMSLAFDHIANGFVTGDANGDLYIARGTLEGTCQGFSYVQDVFQDMISHVRFVFPLDDAEMSGGDTAHSNVYYYSNARTEPLGICDKWSTVPGRVTHRRLFKRRPEICFRGDFYDHFELDYSSVNNASKLSVLLEFTIVLLHELVHCFGFFVENAWADRGMDPRATFSSVLQELGREYELSFFGGKIMTDVAFDAKIVAGEALFPSDLLVLAKWKLERSQPVSGWEMVAEGVPVMYLRVEVIRLWFLQATWSGIQNGINLHSRILKEADRSGLVMQPDGTLLITYDGQMRSNIKWQRRPYGINRWFHNWSLIKEGCTLVDEEETIWSFGGPDDCDELDDWHEAYSGSSC